MASAGSLAEAVPRLGPELREAVLAVETAEKAETEVAGLPEIRVVPSSEVEAA